MLLSDFHGVIRSDHRKTMPTRSARKMVSHGVIRELFSKEGVSRWIRWRLLLLQAFDDSRLAPGILLSAGILFDLSIVVDEPSWPREGVRICRMFCRRTLFIVKERRDVLTMT